MSPEQRFRRTSREPIRIYRCSRGIAAALSHVAPARRTHMRRSFLASCCLVLLTACVPPAVAPPAATRSEPTARVAPTTAPATASSPAATPTRVPAAAQTASVSTGTAAPASAPTVAAVPVGRGERLFALEDPNR